MRCLSFTAHFELLIVATTLLVEPEVVGVTLLQFLRVLLQYVIRLTLTFDSFQFFLLVHQFLSVDSP